ncbi:MAG: DnaJ domain-containing protein [Deltaproteobacteria bacterium]|nr:DnaJ domain-containing protein [Deltaproteobacteria bacterium]
MVAPSPRAEALRRLGLSPSASQLEIKQAFRRLARTLHPDTHPRADAPTRRRLEQRFAEVAGAYREALSPPRH